MTLLTIEQLAVHLSVSARQVQRLTAAGMPSVPVGARGRRYELEECVRWLQENMQQPTQPVGAAYTALSKQGAAAYTEAYKRQRVRVMPSKR